MAMTAAGTRRRTIAQMHRCIWVAVGSGVGVDVAVGVRVGLGRRAVLLAARHDFRRRPQVAAGLLRPGRLVLLSPGEMQTGHGCGRGSGDDMVGLRIQPL